MYLNDRVRTQEESAGGDDGDFEKEEDERNKLYRITEKLEVCKNDVARSVSLTPAL